MKFSKIYKHMSLYVPPSECSTSGKSVLFGGYLRPRSQGAWDNNRVSNTMHHEYLIIRESNNQSQRTYQAKCHSAIHTASPLVGYIDHGPESETLPPLEGISETPLTLFLEVSSVHFRLFPQFKSV